MDESVIEAQLRERIANKVPDGAAESAPNRVANQPPIHTT